MPSIFLDLTNNKKQIFIFFLLLNVLTNFILNNFIIIDEHYFNFLDHQLNPARIQQFISLRKSWVMIGYFFIPVLLLLKITAISLCISIGALFKETTVKFGEIFGISLVSEGVFVLAGIIKVIMLWLLDLNTIEDIQSFYPLSLINLYDISTLKSWKLYIFQQLNLFQITYVIVLSYGFHIISDKNFFDSFVIVISSYGLAFLLWISLLVYFVITL